MTDDGAHSPRRYAERSTVYVADNATNELWSLVASGMKGGTIRVPMGKGLAGACAARGRPLRVDDARHDERARLARELYSVDPDFELRSVIVMPIYAPGGGAAGGSGGAEPSGDEPGSPPRRLIGVLQLMNKRDEDGYFADKETAGTFTAADEAKLERFCRCDGGHGTFPGGLRMSRQALSLSRSAKCRSAKCADRGGRFCSIVGGAMMTSTQAKSSGGLALQLLMKTGAAAEVL